MSYPTGQSTPGSPGRVRPGTVSISGYLLYVVAALQVIGAVISMVYLGDMQRVFEDAFADVDGGEAVATITTVAMVFAAAVGLLVAIGLVLLAFFNNKGKNASRITTWVIGGIFLCCSGANVATTAAGGSFGTGGQADPDMPTNEELQDRLNEVLPSWFNTVTVLLSVIALLALLAALILLALPPSNEFFRKPQAEWQPPVAGQPGYLAYPAYPQSTPPAGQPAQQYPGQPQPHSGQPQPGGQPPAQPYPGQPQAPGQPYPDQPQQPYPGQPQPGGQPPAPGEPPAGSGPPAGPGQ